jgi:uncharacterized membrane protein
MSEAAPARRLERKRLTWLDTARGVAVLAMFAFHFIWDLGHFGYIDPDFPFTFGVKAFGHAIASAFLFIAGISLVLAHGDGPRWRAFWRRLALVAGAAALVSAGTYAAFPKSYVFFGILHCIASASLLAAAFLRLPWPAALAAAIAAAGAPLVFRNAVFDAPLLHWVGLSTFTPITNDYRPLFPWAGALLAGVAATQFWRARGSPTPLAVRERGWPPLRYLGRHSLILYLLHQPLFFAAFSALALLAPLAPPPDATVDFIAACENQCARAGGGRDYCRAACGCTAREAVARGALPDDAGREIRIDEIAKRCAARTR